MKDDFDKKLQETIRRAQKIGNSSRTTDQSRGSEKKSNLRKDTPSGIQETINTAKVFNQSIDTLKQWNEQIRAFYLKIEPGFIVFWKIVAWCSLGLVPLLKWLLKS